MLRSLRGRLIAGFLTVMVLTIALLLLASSQVTTREFRSYMAEGRRLAGEEIVQTLADHFERRGVWQDVRPVIEKLAIRYRNRIVLWDPAGTLVAAADERSPRDGAGMGMMGMMGGARASVVVDGNSVGIVAFSAPEAASTSIGESGFIAGVNRYLLAGGLLAALVAVLLGAALAQRLTSPLKELTTAARRVAAGELDQRVHVKASQEVEELADAFNTMASNLAQSSELRRNLMTDVAHELRTPITSMQVHLEAVLDGAVAADEQTIAVLHAETVRLADLVEELRDLSLAEAGQLQLNREELDLGEIAYDEARVLRPRFDRARVGLAVETEGTASRVAADRRRMAQVLRNLLENALAHTPEGGTVTARITEEQGLVVMSVADTGPGIAAKDLPFVFERFYRANESAEGGSGIGLTIARRLVQAHGGTLDARSAPGEGTEMIARLPAARIDPAN